MRNEHANVQFRINGIMLPDGVSGFGTFLDTGSIGNMSLITGALPAQFGLRTSGVLDIQTRSDAFNNSGTVGVYGGTAANLHAELRIWRHSRPDPVFPHRAVLREQHRTGKSDAELGGDPRPHDAGARLCLCLDHSRSVHALHPHQPAPPTARFRFPTIPGLTPNFTAFGISNFNSALLNENQFEQTYFKVAAWQRSINGADVQLSYFNRYSSVHFIPDPIGDIIFNGVASDVFRSDFANGVTGDIAYRLNEAHTLRAGFLLRTDKTQVTNTDTLAPLDAAGNPIDAPFTVVDPSSLVGYTAGLYLQDEWRLTNSLTLNAGIRFDQYWAYISEYQFSPRISLTWKPFESTTFHAGYARTFTPPEQVLAAPTNLALFQNTTQQPSVNLDVRCGRSAPTSTTSASCSKCCPDWRSASTPITRTRPICARIEPAGHRSLHSRQLWRLSESLLESELFGHARPVFRPRRRESHRTVRGDPMAGRSSSSTKSISVSCVERALKKTQVEQVTHDPTC